MLLWNHANPSRTWLWNAEEVDQLVGSLAGKSNLVPGWSFFLPFSPFHIQSNIEKGKILSFFFFFEQSQKRGKSFKQMLKQSTTNCPKGAKGAHVFCVWRKNSTFFMFLPSALTILWTFCLLERWLSGRKRLIANPLYDLFSYRGFESLSLRWIYL